MSGRQQRVMVQPIVSFITRAPLQMMTPVLAPIVECHLQEPAAGASPMYAFIDCSQHARVIQRQKVVVWLYDNVEMRIEGRIIVRRLITPRVHQGIERAGCKTDAASSRALPFFDCAGLHLSSPSAVIHPSKSR